MTSASATIPVGYKQTEVGVIPEDWGVKVISELFEVCAGGDHDSKRSSKIQSDSFPHPIYANALSNDGLYGFCNYTEAKAGSITITARGSLGHATYRSEPFVAIVRLLILEPKGKIDARYFTEYINFHVEFPIESTGVPQLTAPQVLGQKLPVPSIDEQFSISDVLDSNDFLMHKLENLIEKKRNIKQGAMQELLTGKTRLPGFSGDWRWGKLGDLAIIERGKVITKIETVFGEIPVIAGGMKPAYHHNVSNRSGKTITVSGSGANAGYVSFHNRPIFASDCSTINESSKYSIEFLFFMLKNMQQQIYAEQTGGAQPHIHPSNLNPMQVHIPSEIEEQNGIAEVLSDMDSEIAALEQHLEKIKAIKQGMMQQLLTGRIRLVDPSTPVEASA
jgi:type I restriction enzyme, S subunit